MIFRLTLKLSIKIGLDPLPAIPYDKYRNPLLDWNAHLFTAHRIQYILLTNTASLYSMIMYGRGITNDRQFERGTLSCMKEFMAIDGTKAIFDNFIEPESEDTKVFFSKIFDKRVLGSMNDLIFQARFYLAEGHKSPLDTSLMINESPMSYLKYSRPKDEIRKLDFRDCVSRNDHKNKNNVIHVNFVRKGEPS